MKRKREDDTLITDIIKRVKRCLDNNNNTKKRKREEDSEDDDCCAIYTRKRLKIDSQCNSQYNTQYRRDILVYL